MQPVIWDFRCDFKIQWPMNSMLTTYLNGSVRMPVNAFGDFSR